MVARVERKSETTPTVRLLFTKLIVQVGVRISYWISVFGMLSGFASIITQ